MDPIINPWLIYSISFVDKLEMLVNFIVGFLLIIGILGSVYFLGELSDSYDRRKLFNEEGKFKAEIKKGLKWYFIAFVISITLCLLIPGRTTYISMIMANQVTPDSISGATTFTAEQLDKILKVVVDNINNVK